MSGGGGGSRGQGGRGGGHLEEEGSKDDLEVQVTWEFLAIRIC